MISRRFIFPIGEDDVEVAMVSRRGGRRIVVPVPESSGGDVDTLELEQGGDIDLEQGGVLEREIP